MLPGWHDRAVVCLCKVGQAVEVGYYKKHQMNIVAMSCQLANIAVAFTLGYAKSKVKVKLSRYRHAGAKVEIRYSSYSFLTSTLDGVNGQRHAPAALYPRGKNPRYPLDRRLGGPQSWSGHRG
jgi:hypothetical protein